MKIFVIGCGSIGQRHIKNLLKMGINEIEVYDQNKLLLEKVRKKFRIMALNSLKFNNPDCTLICTPPNSHLKLAKKSLDENSHVFIEKPLSNSLIGLSNLLELSKKKKLNVFVGYVFRFDRGLIKAKQIITQRKIGKVLAFDAYEGWYLPNWRPWQNYKTSYTASEKLGGGIILDGSHELNYLQWLGGKINQIFSYYVKIPKLKVKTEGIAEILILFKSKSIGRIHLDFLNPNYNRHCEILGDEGSIKWLFEKQIIEINKFNQKKPSIVKYSSDYNQMYIDEMKYVVNCLHGKKNDIISLAEGIKTLDISLAIKKSGKTNRVVSIKR